MLTIIKIIEKTPSKIKNFNIKTLKFLGRHKYMVKISLGNPFNKLVHKMNIRKQKRMLADDMGNNDYQRHNELE